MVVYGDAEKADLALSLELFDRLQPVPLAYPLVGPDVELLDVYGLEAEVFQAPFCALPHVVSGEGLVGVEPGGRGPRQVLRRDLGSDVDGLAPLPHDLPDEPLAVAVPVA